MHHKLRAILIVPGGILIVFGVALHYLLPPIDPVNAQESGDALQGRALFQQTCGVCHGADARGIAGLGKNLIESEFVMSLDDDALLTFIRAGRPVDDPVNTTGVAMPPSGGRGDLTDAEMFDIIAFIRNPQAAQAPEETGREADTQITVAATEEAAALEVFAASLDLSPPVELQVTPFTPLPREVSADEAALGRYLFYDSRLSANATVSCASCHLPENAWSDGLALSEGYPSTRYFRNTPTLMNTTFAASLYWDARFGGDDMPSVVRDHLIEPHFMASDGRLITERLRQVPEYMDGFQQVYGGGPSFGRALNALTAYVYSINSAPAPYDDFINGDGAALSAAAQRGLALFEGDAGCAACHNGPTFSDNLLYVTGVPENMEIFSDPLRHVVFRRFMRNFAVSDYSGLREDVGALILNHDEDMRGAFRTPPLRELCYTAPFMHNGVFATLDEVVAFYNAGAALDLTGEQQSDIVAFLESLCSELPETIAPDLPEYRLRTLGDNR